MTFEDVARFLKTNHQGVMVTFRRRGAAQMSIVTCGYYEGGVAFTTTGDRAKLANLIRNPNCSILVSTLDWSGYAVVEGTADIRFSDRTDREELRLTLRDVYRACADREHPDWEEYDRAMVDDRRAAIIVKPLHVYAVRM